MLSRAIVDNIEVSKLRLLICLLTLISMNWSLIVYQ